MWVSLGIGLGMNPLFLYASNKKESLKGLLIIFKIILFYEATEPMAVTL